MEEVSPAGECRPVCGVGIGLRDPHFQQLMDADHGIPWLELLADNFIARGGLTRRQLDRIVERYPVTLHCVGMNLGGSDPIDFDYLGAVREIAQCTGAAWVSDHLCFTAHHGRHYHDLLPLPFDDEAVRHVAQRVVQVQDFLGQRLVVENVSAYVRAEAPLSEIEFVTAVCTEADCELLIDINNLYVNQVNLGFDALDALDALPLARVRQMHLAGFEDRGHFLVDAHNNPVSEPVWQLFGEAALRLPEVPVCIEWDNDIPALEVLLMEARRADAMHRAAGQAA